MKKCQWYFPQVSGTWRGDTFLELEQPCVPGLDRVEQRKWGRRCQHVSPLQTERLVPREDPTSPDPHGPSYSSAKPSALQWHGPFGLENLWKDTCSLSLLLGGSPGVTSFLESPLLHVTASSAWWCRQGLGLVWSLNCKVQDVIRREIWTLTCTAAAAKSLQLCLTLRDPIDGSPPGFPVPGILQARTLEWVAISFSNAWKWKMKVKSLSHVRL